MTQVKIKLNGSAVETSTITIYDANRAPDDPVVDSANGPPLTVGLPDGTYVLLCTVSGSPGPFGPVVVSDSSGTQLGISDPGEINDQNVGSVRLRFKVASAAAAVAAN